MTTGSQRPQRVLVEPGDQTDHDQLSIDAIPRPGLGIGDRAIRIHFRPIDVENRFGLNHGILHIAHPRNRLHGAGIDQTILYKAIIDIDSNYSDGGGYFMLGAVHLKSPYIPFILSWPSDEEALNYLSLAYETGDATPNQTVYLARALYINDEKQKAISMLNSLLDEKISESNKLEDIEQHNIAEEQLKDWK